MMKIVLPIAVAALLAVAGAGCTAGRPLPENPRDTFQLSLEGMHNLYVLNKKSEASLERTQVLRKIHSDLMEDDFEVALNIQSPDAPLVVFIAGIFGSYESPEMIYLGQQLFDRGFNILRFPNTTSRWAVKQKPRFSSLDFQEEARLYAEVIEKIAQENHFPQVDLVGSSYGGFLAAVTSNHLNPRPSRVVLLSPPRNLGVSLKTIDGYFDQMDKQFHSFPWRQIGLAVRMKWAGFWRRPINVGADVAKDAVINSAFRRNALNLIELDKENRSGQHWGPFLARFSPRFSKEQYAMRFTDYLANYNPGFFSEPEKQDVMYWLNRGGSQWQVFTTKDDFITPEAIWPTSRHITVYPTGGHIFGYMNRTEFLESFLNTMIEEAGARKSAAL